MVIEKKAKKSGKVEVKLRSKIQERERGKEVCDGECFSLSGECYSRDVGGVNNALFKLSLSISLVTFFLSLSPSLYFIFFCFTIFVLIFLFFSFLPFSFDSFEHDCHSHMSFTRITKCCCAIVMTQFISFIISREGYGRERERENIGLD